MIVKKKFIKSESAIFVTFQTISKKRKIKGYRVGMVTTSNNIITYLSLYCEIELDIYFTAEFKNSINKTFEKFLSIHALKIQKTDWKFRHPYMPLRIEYFIHGILK